MSPYNADGSLRLDNKGVVLGAFSGRNGKKSPEHMEKSETMTTIIMRTSEGDMRVMFLLWDATSGNKSLKIVEIPIKTAPRALNNPDFPEK